MKKLKKVFAVLLTLAMVLGMSMTSFAAEKANINVRNLNEGAQVSYKKLVSLDAKGEWKIEVDGLNMTLEQLEAAVNEQKNAANGKINPKLEDLDLSKVTTDASTMKTADKDGNVTFNVEAGLYAIKAVDPGNVYNYSWMVAFVGYEGTEIMDASVVAKGESNQISKVITNTGDGDNDKTVAPGDEVEYKITVAYPFFATDADEKNFVIQDKVTNGTIKAGSVKVDAKYGFDVNSYGGTDTLTLTLKTYDSNLAKETVEIEYTVVVGNVTASSPLKNVATSTINGGTATRTEVETPTFSATVTKTNEDGKTALKGAKFTLYVEVPNDTVGGVTDVVTGKTVKAIATDVDVNNNGTVTFDGLDAQKNYWVKETKAPEGYQIVAEAMPLTNDIVMEETKTPAGKQTIEGVEYTVTKITYSAKEGTGYNSVGFNDGLNFHNTNLSSLPSTGGIGTTIFTIGGCVIMIAAAALFFASRRKSAK